eukprot:1033938-Ditylum_brightwellii.AAC.2
MSGGRGRGSRGRNHRRSSGSYEEVPGATMPQVTEVVQTTKSYCLMLVTTAVPVGMHNHITKLKNTLYWS